MFTANAGKRYQSCRRKNGIATGEIIEDYPDTKKFEDDLKTRRKR